MPAAPGRTPKPVPLRGDSPTSPPLSSAEERVLACVDGVRGEDEVIAQAGMDPELARWCLDRLANNGFIVFEDPPRAAPAPPAPAPAPPPRQSPAPDARRSTSSSGNMRAVEIPETQASARRTDGRAGSSLTDDERAALAEDVDLEDDLRRRVIYLLKRLDEMDHYALLGIDAKADRRTVKRAYFELAAKYHPDKYFRKRLGSFQLRMETIFGRITLAHDVLTSTERRAEYDAYLVEQRELKGIEDKLAGVEVEAKRAQEIAEREAQQARDSAPVPAAPPSGEPQPELQLRQQGLAVPDTRPATTTSPAAAPLTTPSTTPGAAPNIPIDARREALARRLLGGRTLRTASGSFRAGGGPSSKPPAGGAHPSANPTADAMNALRHRYEARVAQARAAQASKYIATGEEALGKGDVVSAANAFRVAMTLLPDDATVAAKARDSQSRADEILSETYTRQATYQEKSGQWSEAAHSWGRVAQMRPTDARAAERAAHAITLAGGDLHEAARLAKLACELMPNDSGYRIALANVYMAAGLTLNARKTLEAAAQLAPQDGTIQEMLKRVGKSA